MTSAPAPPAGESPTLDRIYDLEDMAGGDCIFAATGVTDGSLLDGVHRLPGGCVTTESIVMRASSGTVRRVRTEHRKGALA
jgi:fructose-1,6-bisphosphatase II / sedoheptulose-1,7-bisphosphatase